MACFYYYFISDVNIQPGGGDGCLEAAAAASATAAATEKEPTLNRGVYKVINKPNSTLCLKD